MKIIALLLLFFVNVLTAQQRFYSFDTLLNQQKNEFTKQQTIDAIKSYYEGFKTGSYVYAEEHGKAIAGSDNYTKFTDNYSVEITDCIFKISFDVYNNDEIENTTTIELDFSNIKSLKKGSQEGVNRNILFQMVKSKKIKVSQKFKDKTILKEWSHFEIKIYPNYNAYPNQKHPDFKDDTIVNYFNQLIVFCEK
nr:hypothetical protein [uncultured Flavobacterium sp.]